MTDRSLSAEEFQGIVQRLRTPVVTASQVARELECSQAEASDLLEDLATAGRIGRADVSDDPVVWYPADLESFAEREHLIPFPDRREVVVEHPRQFTRAQLAQFAHLVDATGDAYLYRIREEDVWQAPYDGAEDLLATVRDVLPERSPHLEEWIERQWSRAHRFTLVTYGDDETGETSRDAGGTGGARGGYTVLRAASDDLMGNVALQKLEQGEHVRAPIDDDEVWINEGAVGEVKRILYEAGYPVQDRRDLERGEPLEFDLRLDLREYQRSWVERFTESKSGVLVGPPGSGKTVAAMGAMAEVGAETLVLVPSRDLADQWHRELLERTTLTDDQIGEYHGGTKEIRPVTIATYQTAGMDRHRRLFDEREWGLIVYDEVHHVPSEIYKRSTDLQAKHRLGLSATPIREDDREKEIFTLIGPPIGTDWGALFDAGFVAEPEVEIRYVPWADEYARNEYVTTTGHERRQAAATNPAKVEAVRTLLGEHAGSKVLVFVDYLEQGQRLSEELGVPFISGEMRHGRRQVLFEEFRGRERRGAPRGMDGEGESEESERSDAGGADGTAGERDVLIISRVGDEGIDLPNAEVAVVASGLGGSRRQGAQRAGRTMRPVGSALMYVLATRGTTEEDFARQQLRHLAGKGIRITERDAPQVDGTGNGAETGSEVDSGDAGAAGDGSSAVSSGPGSTRERDGGSERGTDASEDDGSRR